MYRYMAEHYDAIFPPEGKVQFLKDGFKAFQGGQILDIGCSNGSVAKGLFEAGFSVTGIDFSAEMIRAAEADGCGAVHFRQMDMLDVATAFPAHAFDGVYCVGNTLVHLSGPAEISKALEGFRYILKPGGLLILQILNYTHILRTRPSQLPLIDAPPIRFERYYTYEADAIQFRTRLHVSGDERVYEGCTRLYPLEYAELETLLLQQGFKLSAIKGSFSGAPFDANGLPLIVLAR